MPSESPIPNPQSPPPPKATADLAEALRAKAGLAPLAKDSSRISGMFDAIAERYDFLNHLLSAGLDKQWRRRAIETLELNGRETVLDLCTGTADLAFAAISGQRRAKRVIGVDFSAAMLQIGKVKAGRLGRAHV